MTDPTTELSELSALEELSIGEGDLVRDLTLAASAPIPLGEDLIGRIMPEGWKLETLDLGVWLEKPPRSKSGGPQMYDAQSLIDYVGQQDEKPRLYAEVYQSTITAVFDDHWDDQPGRQAFAAVYRLRHSPEWSTLCRADGVFHSPEEFADFIEDLQHVIAMPYTADLLDLVRRFKASKIASLVEHHDDKSGDRVFRYETETQISDELIAPDEFIFALPVYRGQDPVEVRARFRYRATGSGVAFGLKLIQRERLLEDAFEAEVDTIEKGAGGGRAIRGSCS